MKVLSIKEPYASLIMNGDKKIETRSFKTNYRGPLYIHASGKKIDKKYLEKDYVMSLANNIDMNFGYIICVCDLVDCIYMTEEFIENIKKNEKEYNCGLYEVGRYAWVLKNVRKINKISAKVKLNIWNYDNLQ